MSISEGIDLSRHGLRRIIVATGHDEASSILAQDWGTRLAAQSWRTPNGETVKEGGRYEVESRLVLKIVRIDSPGISTLRFGYRDFLVSERLDV